MVLEGNPALVAAFRRGDRTALEQVYWAYVNEVERVLRRGVAASRLQGHGLSAPDVHDLLHETFVRAFEERARLAYDGLRPYAPFVCTIARNLVIDAVRKHNREVALADFDLPDDAPEPEVPWAEPATVRAVEQYLAHLSPQ